ncbi:MAG: hypothetical protein E6J20_21055 [Chloroflexi bacterium]|nr:MAG: hypothetical protein E6J20_21055 [Chloroflexota bacterium]
MVELLEEAYTSIGDTADPRPAIVRVPDGPLSDQADAILGPARRILVLDDALVTGATLSTLRGRIYDANQLRQHAAEVGAFVVVLRPADERAVQRLARRYRDAESGVQVGYAERVYLPDDQECPWCKEIGMLERAMIRPGGRHGWIEERRESALGEVIPPLLPGARSGGAPLYTERAFFGRLDQRTAFAAVCAAVWEDCLEVDGHENSIVPHYVDLELLFDAYYDPIIKVAALRTLHRRHVRMPGMDWRIDKLIRSERVDEPSAYYYELALAAASTTVPERGVLELLEQCAVGSELRSAWVDLVNGALDTALT